MAGFRHDHETGERVYAAEESAPIEPAPSPGPPMVERGWVELFLGPNEHGLPLYSPPRPNRRAARKSRRRL